MNNQIWEDYISLNSRAILDTVVLSPAAAHLGLNDGSVIWDETRLPLATAVARDTSPLPIESDRELYYGANHYAYWASGLRDVFQILDWASANDFSFDTTLDIGCASGRVVRHLHYQTDVSRVIGCDINRLHVEWISRYLPPAIAVFQNTSIPTLPLASDSADLVTAFSVFTHIDSFDTTWLMELRRILRPGGVAWLTIQGDRVWRELKPGWPLYDALDTHPDYALDRQHPELPRERMVYRWVENRAYSANVFHSYAYVRRVWGRIMAVVDILPAIPPFQDIVVLRK
jgi:SAM-dependent methyltransferase